MLLLDRLGVRDPAIGVARAWKDVAAAALLLTALAAGRARLRAGGRLRMRPADRLALICAFLFVGLTLLPYAGTPLGQRLAGLRVDVFFLVFFALGRLLPAAARIRSMLPQVAMAIAGALGVVGVVEWFFSPLRLLDRLGYGDFLVRSAGVAGEIAQIPPSYFTALGVRRSGSLMLDPVSFGQLCVIGAAAALTVHMVSRGVRPAALGVLGATVAGLAVSRSRTAVAAYVVVAVFACLHSFAVRWGRRTVPGFAAASAVLAVVLVIAVPRASSVRQQPTEPATTATTRAPAIAHPSLQAHVDGLERTWNSLRRHPWGQGPGSSQLVVTREAGPVARQNQFFILAVEGGWPVLLAVSLLMVAIAAGLLRRGPDHRMASTTGLMFLMAALATALTAQILLNYALVALAFLAAGAGLPPVIEDRDQPDEPAVLRAGRGTRSPEAAGRRR